MNIAIIGYGNVGKHYVEQISHFKKIKKIFIVDENRNISIKKNRLLKGKNILKIDFNKIHNLKIDYAIICTPSGSHFYYANFFLKRGIDTLIEKPFVLSIKESRDLINLKKKRKSKCWVALQNRYNKAIIKAREVIKRKKFGDPFLVDAALYWHRSKKYYKTSWRGKYKSDGGVLFNQSIHLLDAIVRLFGPIKVFNAFAGFNPGKLQAEDLISINLKHKKKNLISNLKATTRANRDYRMSLDVLCDKGRFIIKDISLNKIFYFTPSLKIDRANSEVFTKGMGPKSGMGNGHRKILKEFFNKKLHKSSQDLEIEKNSYIIKLINSVYNSLFANTKFDIVQEKEFKYKG